MTVVERSRIVTLPQSVANRIAAGEVVERPAAVVKELIENSIDAAPTRITVVIEDAGRTLIKVVDDGIGMTESDLATAIGRYSTSKINRFEDLEHLTTFGFRGEALPSIAAVSRLTITSRARGNDVGNELKAAGGKVEKYEPVAAPEGTSVSVSHLYFNVPARRKFLRKDTTEIKWIVSVFKYYTLSFPGISWQLYRNDELFYDFPATDGRGRLASVFGDDVAEEMIEIDHRHGWLKVNGWISPASLAQRTVSDQFMFINRRSIYNYRLNKAVQSACEPYYISGGHPIYVILLEAAPDMFDINVHPAKKEVKFADENGAYRTVWGAIKTAFKAEQMPEELTGASLGRKQASHTTSSAIRSPVDAPSHLTPFVPAPHHQKDGHVPVLPFPPVRKLTPDSDRTQDTIPSSFSKADRSVNTPIRNSEEGPVIWQVFDTYLLSQLKTGLVLIDQHVAHERVLYERALRAIEKEPWVSQQLLFPVSLTVSPEDFAIIDDCLPLLKAMGFAVEPIGPRDFRIFAVPTGIKISNERDMLLGIIAEYRETLTTDSDPRHILAAAFACRGAVKAGQPLNTAQMQRLVDELFQTEDPEFCPHGRPIYHVISRKEIDKWFKR
ncbi:MAG: DNA mismatch repair endonuclease MutL [Candidatus Hatepunaea meridiana]|nr:DNA mismatch repair endonuclease MutL [Candidatus Hatepunaea meridiana]